MHKTNSENLHKIAIPIKLFTILLLTAVISSQPNEYQLQRLKSFWQGEGVAVPYPDRILLTSDKLINQSGSVVSMDKLTWGKYFSIELTLDYHITDPETSQQNFILALTPSKGPIIPFQKENPEYVPMFPGFEGLTLYLNNFDTTHVGWFTMQSPNKAEMLSRGKVTKIGARQKNQIRFLIRSKDNTINVYYEDPKDNTLSLCAQFVDLQLPESFYVYLGGSDDSGKAQVTVSKLTIQTETNFEVVPEENKKVGDNFLAYWAEDMTNKGVNKGNNPTEDISNFKAAAMYYYDNAKVYSEELMDLADKSLVDLKKQISRDLGRFSERMKDATDIISREADQLEALGWILTENKNQHKVNMVEVLDMSISWLETIEDSVAKTDQETKAIFDLVTKLNVGTFTEELIDRSEQLIVNLKKLNFKANFLSNEEGLNFLDEKSTLKDMFDNMSDFASTVEDKIKNKPKQSVGKFGIVLLGLVGVLLLGGFFVVYWKISSAISKNTVTGFD